MSGRDGWRAAPALPALLLAVLGGLLVAQRQGLWYDELYTAELARTPLREVLRAIATGTATAPWLQGIPPSYNGPYYVVVHLWLALTPFGADDVGLRLLSLVAAVAAAGVLTAAVTRLAGSPATGLAAGLAFAANPLVVEYAAEARGYGLALLAVAVTALGLARWLDGRSLWLYGIGGAATGLAHWFALPVLGALAVAALVLRRRAALPLLGVTALAALPTLGLVALAVGNGAGGENVGFIRDTGGDVPRLSAEAWTAGSRVLLVATAVALALGLRRGRASVVGACWVALPVLAVTLAELLRPVFVPRYLLPALAGLAVLAGLGVVHRRRGVTALLTAALVGCSLWAGLPLLDRGPREDGRGAVAWLAAAQSAGEPVVAVDPRAALALVHYGDLGRDLRLPPDDAPEAEVVWLLRATTPTGLRLSDDDALLARAGLQLTQQRVFDGSNTDLVVQRFAR